MNFTTASKLDLAIAEAQGKIKITRLPSAKPKKSDLWLTQTKGTRTNTNRQGQMNPHAQLIR